MRWRVLRSGAALPCDKGEYESRTEWHRVFTWRNRANAPGRYQGRACSRHGSRPPAAAAVLAAAETRVRVQENDPYSPGAHTTTDLPGTKGSRSSDRQGRPSSVSLLSRRHAWQLEIEAQRSLPLKECLVACSLRLGQSENIATYNSHYIGVSDETSHKKRTKPQNSSEYQASLSKKQTRSSCEALQFFQRVLARSGRSLQ